MENIKNPSRRGLFSGKIKQNPSLRLPWTIDESSFVNGCVQCEKCIDVCETQVIVKDLAGFPKIDFSQGEKECTFCHQCVDACEEPLFIKDKTKAPWPAKLSISNQCLASNNIYCQSCRDVCEPRAISFTLQTSSVPIPEINPSDCTSCGACLSTCPQDAISFVNDKEVHYA